MVLIDIFKTMKFSGVIAEKALEECNIVINRNNIFGDQKSPMVTSGIRLGSNTTALRKFGEKEVIYICELIHEVLTCTQASGDKTYALDEAIKLKVKEKVNNLCKKFRVPSYE